MRVWFHLWYSWDSNANPGWDCWWIFYSKEWIKVLDNLDGASNEIT